MAKAGQPTTGKATKAPASSSKNTGKVTAAAANASKKTGKVSAAPSKAAIGKGTTSKKRATAKPRAHSIDLQQRGDLIAEAAYLRAETGFQGDLAMADWLQAEVEVDARLAGRK